MPFVLILALASSLALHGAALFGTDVEMFGSESEPLPLRVELPPLPAPPPVVAEPVRPVVKAPPKKPRHRTPANTSAAPVARMVPPATEDGQAMVAEAVEPASPPPPPPPISPARPVLAASGVLRFAIIKESLGFQVGRAEHRWEFREDGHYRLLGVTETSGLAALLKPVRLEIESQGRMVPGGLQPERLRSRKNGQDSNENADFDWEGGVVSLSRDGSVREIAKGTQDILSLNYQLAYLGRLAEGASIGVVTGKKYERYALDSMGEEDIDTPAGHFRTLHLRAMTDNTTEIWIALDRQRLPVKIRFTDKKGERFVQELTEIGSVAETAP
ncbi:MAG: DUF3108 domain-containing protein [Rhodocyclales bacterium GT-UBC]|nr:MAG: DUF3108 domain-containing protein [Rhodocyclales bacterium GT-UBC]